MCEWVLGERVTWEGKGEIVCEWVLGERDTWEGKGEIVCEWVLEERVRVGFMVVVLIKEIISLDKQERRMSIAEKKEKKGK